MAIGLENYPNIETPDSDYPDGDIRDNPGDYTGTPYNRRVYGDIHQVFAKLLRLAAMTASTLPENEYNGFQYIEALNRLATINEIRTITGIIQTTVIDTSENKLINYDSGAANGHVASLDPDTDERDTPRCVITNNSANAIDVFDNNGNDINGVNTGFTLAANLSRTFMYDRANLNWVTV